MIADMRRLFKLDESSAQAVEDALLVHGGGGAQDLERPGEDTSVQQTAN